MSMIPFRDYHLLQILEAFEEKKLPLDRLLYEYFRSHKSLGSKDRGEIVNTLFPMIRWQELIDYHLKGTPTWERRLELFRNLPEKDSSLPEHIQVSFPEILYNEIVASHGKEKAKEICLASNTSAPTTLRVNPEKTTREQLLTLFEGAKPCDEAPFGITLEKRENLFGLLEFKKGFFEMQDEGSQLLAELVDPKPGDLVLDYCAGSGGKTLAFAYKMQGKGQIFLHDVREHILQEAKKRLKRAGIQNAQSFMGNRKDLKKKMDWVLVDAPCSGTGTLRRNPDMKKKFSLEMVNRLIGQQRTIFEQALSYLKPGGSIVYATCSLLAQENLAQVEHFCKTYDLKMARPPFQSLPSEGGMDGFFGVCLHF